MEWKNGNEINVRLSCRKGKPVQNCMLVGMGRRVGRGMSETGVAGTGREGQVG